MELLIEMRRQPSKPRAPVTRRVRLRRRAKAGDDIQRLLVEGYRDMPVAAFLFLHIRQADHCKSWLADTVERVTTASVKIEPANTRTGGLHLALTPAGLKQLGLPDDVMQTFPYEFLRGIRSLSNPESFAPDDDPWPLGRSGQPDTHLLLMLYARSAQDRERMIDEEVARLREGGLEVRFVQRGEHDLQQVGAHRFSRDHFGFRDGLSQPRIKGFMDSRHHAPDYDRPLKPGEFILGHPNEYNELPDSPSVPARLDQDGLLPRSPHKGRKDLGHDGSYLALMKLEQDVEAFNAFLDSFKESAPPGDGEARREWVAAKLMGRWRNGAPLEENGGCPLHRLGLLRRRTSRASAESPSAHVPEPRLVHGDIDNQFLYATRDAEGFGCPVTSHVRRTNPRDALLPPRKRLLRPPSHDLSLEVSRRHRLLRRGINYTDTREGHPARKGLIFIALNANLARQFEFVERSWMRYDRPSGQFGAPDPLAGESGGQCVIPGRLHLMSADLKRFVTYRGGAYFFLPSIKALRFLAALEPRAQ